MRAVDPDEPSRSPDAVRRTPMKVAGMAPREFARVAPRELDAPAPVKHAAFQPPIAGRDGRVGLPTDDELLYLADLPLVSSPSGPETDAPPWTLAPVKGSSDALSAAFQASDQCARRSRTATDAPLPQCAKRSSESTDAAECRLSTNSAQCPRRLLLPRSRPRQQPVCQASMRGSAATWASRAT
jgi:hypothetical protein